MTDTLSFADLNLPARLVKNLHATGITSPKPIQQQVIPALLNKKDVLAIAQTGSGKTLAFVAPIVAQIMPLAAKRQPKSCRALILVPTRELAQQIDETVCIAMRQTHMLNAVVVGGASRALQMKRLEKGVDVLIATPGRLLDLVRERALSLAATETLILDEADRMLDMGFIKDIHKIAKLISAVHQTALFSATMPKDIMQLATQLLRNPLHVKTAQEGSPAKEIEQIVYEVKTQEKKKLLAHLLRAKEMESTIVFARTKHGAENVAKFLTKENYKVGAIHGNKTQNARQKTLKNFRSGALKVLVGTDIVARGIDVVGVSHVINYDLPDEGSNYVHRIGRTGRNGQTGKALTLYDKATEGSRMRSVERSLKKKLLSSPLPAALEEAAKAAPKDSAPTKPVGPALKGRKFSFRAKNARKPSGKNLAKAAHG